MTYELARRGKTTHNNVFIRNHGKRCALPSPLHANVWRMKKKIIKPTPFGPIAVIWSRFDGSPKIVRVLLSTPELSAEDQAPRLYPNSQASSCAAIDAVATAIKAFLKGEYVVFPLDVADLKPYPAFQKAVFRAAHQITAQSKAESLKGPQG